MVECAPLNISNWNTSCTSFFGQPPSGLLTGYPAGIPGRSGIPVGSIENILVNI